MNREESKSLAAAAQWIYGSIKSDNSLLEPSEQEDDNRNLPTITEEQDFKITEVMA